MEVSGEASVPPSARLLEILARTLRHEVGDLLQTVYSAVAILEERLAADQELERRLLGDLKGKAVLCRQELDAAVDWVCPMTLNLTPLDLSQLTARLAATFAGRYPALEVRSEATGPVSVLADSGRLDAVGQLLLLSACQAARHQVCIGTRRDEAAREVEWSVADDGHGATPEQLVWLDQPFTTTRHAQFGLGLALARRVVALHGGRVAADNLPEGGFRVRLLLPTSPPPP
jgi:signal transduction histidine kinase